MSFGDDTLDPSNEHEWPGSMAIVRDLRVALLNAQTKTEKYAVVICDLREELKKKDNQIAQMGAVINVQVKKIEQLKEQIHPHNTEK